MSRKATSKVAEERTTTYEWSVTAPNTRETDPVRRFDVSLTAKPSHRRVYGESIGLRTRDPAAVVRKLREGLPVSCFDRLQAELGVTSVRLAVTVNIAPRTLARRKKEGRLHCDESERVLRIARLFDRAIDVLGDAAVARQWLMAPKRALGGVVPLDFADTEPGAEEVLDLLGRIEHGVFA